MGGVLVSCVALFGGKCAYDKNLENELAGKLNGDTPYGHAHAGHSKGLLLHANINVKFVSLNDDQLTLLRNDLGKHAAAIVNFRIENAELSSSGIRMFTQFNRLDRLILKDGFENWSEEDITYLQEHGSMNEIRLGNMRHIYRSFAWEFEPIPKDETPYQQRCQDCWED